MEKSAQKIIWSLLIYVCIHTRTEKLYCLTEEPHTRLIRANGNLNTEGKEGNKTSVFLFALTF